LIYVRFWLNFCVSGKFPATAWWAVQSRQAAHAIVRNLGS